MFYILIALVLTSPAMAAGELDKTAVAATASYVEGAYNAMDAAKQDKLTSTNVVESGSGPMVTGVTANNGTVTVSKGEVTIPVGAATSTTRATIWFESTVFWYFYSPVPPFLHLFCYSGACVGIQSIQTRIPIRVIPSAAWESSQFVFGALHRRLFYPLDCHGAVAPRNDR